MALSSGASYNTLRRINRGKGNRLSRLSHAHAEKIALALPTVPIDYLLEMSDSPKPRRLRLLLSPRRPGIVQLSSRRDLSAFGAMRGR